MQAIGQNLFSKESALNFVSTFAVGLIPSRFTHITAKESALIGTVAGGLTSLSNALAGKDASTLKKVLFSTVALALTYFSFARLAPLLNKRLMVQLYPAAILQVLAFNALGHVVSFVITKIYLTTLWNMSDDQIKTLHSKHEKNPKLYDQLSKVEKLLLYHRFDKLGLDTNNVEDEPTKEEIEALTDDQVRTLHEHEAYVVQDDSDSKALIFRYYNLNLAPFENIENEIESLVIPKTVEDIDKIEDNQLKWYAIYFKKHPDKLADISDDSIKWALFIKKVAKNYQIPESPADHPKTAEEVKALDEGLVRAYNKADGFDNLPANVQKALNLRFYEMELPFPGGLTVDSIENSDVIDYPDIDIQLPASVEEVNQLHDNQLSWIFAVGNAEVSGFSSLPFEIQIALNTRFQNTLDSWHYFFNLNKISADDIKNASETTMNILQEDLGQQLDNWIQINRDVYEAFQKKLTENGYDILDAFKAIDTTNLKKSQAKRFLEYFRDVGVGIWVSLDVEKQGYFKQAFQVHGFTGTLVH